MTTKRSELVKKMMKITDFLWIVPSTIDLNRGYFEEWAESFTILDLMQNFRNSREIVRTTKSYAEEKEYDYKKGIVMPPFENLTLPL